MESSAQPILTIVSATNTDELLDLGESVRRAIDPLALMQRVADQLMAMIAGADGVLLGLTLDADSVRFVCGAGHVAGRVGERLALRGSLVGEAIDSGKTLVADDTELDPRVNLKATRAYGVRSSVCVPLRREEERLGVLCVSSPRPRAFDARDLALLGGLADFLTAVIGAACEFTTATNRLHGERRSDEDGCAEIERIVRERDFRVVLQPIFALRDGGLFAAEALVRFPDAALAPDVCLARAHEMDLGVELELAIVEVALACLPRLPRDTLLAINAGPRAIACERIADAMEAADPARLIVELTEHIAVGDYPRLASALQQLRELGVRLAVDDAGAGFASLMHILKLAPDFIKLDRELTAGIDIDPVRRSLAASLLRFAHETGAVIVAEGIETAAELTVLHDLGIDHGQGFHLARPGPPDALRKAAREGAARIDQDLRAAAPLTAVAS